MVEYNERETVAAQDTNTAHDGALVAPRTPVEERVASIVASLLGLEQVGVDDNFLLLGGHSLLGIQIITRVCETFGVELPLRSLFEAPTVAQLSTTIEQIILVKLDDMSEDEVQHVLQYQ